jgi:UDP-glucose 4-epimerase
MTGASSSPQHPPRVLVVTGVSGLLGQRLLPLLDAIEGVDRIVGLDVREPPRRVASLDFHLLDLTNAELKPLFEGVDTVVHLASAVGPLPDGELARRINVEGTRRVLDAASAAGVRKLVRASSATVYGAWAQNSRPLTEDAPLRPNPRYLPALHDAECERITADWQHEHPGTVMTTLRLAPVVGAGARSLFALAAIGRVPVHVRGEEHRVQVLHVDDAAAALALAVAEDLDGVFNVAADGWLEPPDALAVAPHRRPPAVPAPLARRTLETMWASGIGDAPPEVLPYLQHSWVISNDRIKAHGWSPRHTNEEAILLAGDPEARRRPLPWIAAVGAVLTGAVGATWWLRARSRR